MGVGVPGGRVPPALHGQAAHLEQGDRGAVEEAQEEEDDEGGGHGVEVLEAFFLGAHFTLCRRHGTVGQLGRGARRAHPVCPSTMRPPGALGARQKQAGGREGTCTPAPALLWGWELPGLPGGVSGRHGRPLTTRSILSLSFNLSICKYSILFAFKPSILH